MRMLDIIKDAVAAFLILAANILVLVLVMFVYGTFIEPGHDNAFYEAAAPRIALWSAPIAGAALFFLTGLFRIPRNPGRGAILLTLSTWVCYVAIDIIAGVAMAGDTSFMSPHFAFSLSMALAGGLLATRMVRA